MEPSLRSPIALLLAVALLVSACDRQSADAPQGEPAVPLQPGEAGKVSIEQRGTRAPDIALAHPDGREMRLADFEGRPLLVNLWATWCAPCIAELPTLEALAEDSGDALKVLTVSQDLDGAGVVEPFLDARGFTQLEPWLDPENALMTALGVDALPTTVLYDENGTELFRVRGDMDWSGEEARRLIEVALAQ